MEKVYFSPHRNVDVANLHKNNTNVFNSIFSIAVEELRYNYDLRITLNKKDYMPLNSIMDWKHWIHTISIIHGSNG